MRRCGRFWSGCTAGRLLQHFWLALVLTSVLAGLASAPVRGVPFGQVQVYSCWRTWSRCRWTAVWVMPAGLAALALMPLGLERLALAPMGWGIDVVLAVARFVAGLPEATIRVPHMPGWGLALVGLGLAWLGLWHSRLRLAGVAAILAGLLSGMVSPAADLLVSNDARLIALSAPGGAYLQTRPGFSRFVRDSWTAILGNGPGRAVPRKRRAGSGSRCDVDGCRIQQGGAGGADWPAACARWIAPALRWSSRPTPVRAVCPALPRIDRFTVWRGWRAGGLAGAGGGDGGLGPCPPRRPALGAAVARRSGRVTLPLAPMAPLPD